MSGEVIIAAAIRFNTDMVKGKNHSVCLIKVKNACEQGFIAATRNFDNQRFVNRKEALEIAINAGQKINKHNPQGELTSEDLSEDNYFLHK